MKKVELHELNAAFPQFMPGEPVYIYGLIDPETDEIRYIGKSTRPTERLADHCNEVSSCHRSHWIQSLKSKGLKPEMVILERIVGNWPWQESERRWIAYGRANGWNLVNNTDGGDGVRGLPEETKKKIATAWIGRKHKPESLLKIAAASASKRHSKQTKEKMSKAHKGRVITWGDKLSESLRKLSSDDVSKIAREIAGGAKVKDLAVKYGAHRTTISKIKAGTYYEKFRA